MIDKIKWNLSGLKYLQIKLAEIRMYLITEETLRLWNCSARHGNGMENLNSFKTVEQFMKLIRQQSQKLTSWIYDSKVLASCNKISHSYILICNLSSAAERI